MRRSTRSAGSSGSGDGEDGHGERQRPKRLKSGSKEGHSCPTCGLTVRVPEIEAHLQLELSRLTKISQNRLLSQRPQLRTGHAGAGASPQLRTGYASASSPASGPPGSAGADSEGEAGSYPTPSVMSSVTSSTNDVTSSPAASGQHSTNLSLININGMPGLETFSSLAGQSSSSELHSNYSMPLHVQYSSLGVSTPLASTSGLRRRHSKKKMVQQLEMFKKVRSVRDNRLQRSLSVQRRLSEQEARTCPQCHRVLPVDDLALHIDHCQEEVEGGEEDDDGSAEDEEDGARFEQYEWCGQTRVRATEVLRAQGQLHSLGTVLARCSEDDDVDVCNDADFGPQQFFRASAGTDDDVDADTEEAPEAEDSVDVDDVMLDTAASTETSATALADACAEACNNVYARLTSRNNFDDSTSSQNYHFAGGHTPVSSNCVKNTNNDDNSSFTNQLTHGKTDHSKTKKLPLCNGSSVASSSSSTCSTSDYVGQLQDTAALQDANHLVSALAKDGNSRDSFTSPRDSRLIIESLTQRIKKLEMLATENVSKMVTCSVCQDCLDLPVVSTVCWHVHCQQCWMSSIASKPTCPQCKAICSEAHLRRVYM